MLQIGGMKLSKANNQMVVIQQADTSNGKQQLEEAMTAIIVATSGK